MHRFVSLLNARRLLRDLTFERRRMSLNQVIQQANKTWHGVKLGQPDWSHHSHSLAFEAKGPGGLHVYRDLPRIAAGHRSVGGSAYALRSQISGGGAVRRGAVQRACARGKFSDNLMVLDA